MLMSIEEIKLEVEKRKSHYERAVGEARMVRQQFMVTKDELDNLNSESSVITKAIYLLNSLSESQQYNAQRTIERIVTEGLQLVCEDPTLDFKIEQNLARGQMTMGFSLAYKRNKEDIETDVYGARGGGIVAVIGFLLQVVFIVLMRNRVRQVLFLDEALVQLSARYRPALSRLMRQLVDNLGIQIILVTHENVYAEEADLVYKFVLNERGETSVLAVGERTTSEVPEMSGEEGSVEAGTLGD